jgi:hypothetical protein
VVAQVDERKLTEGDIGLTPDAVPTVKDGGPFPRLDVL